MKITTHHLLLGGLWLLPLGVGLVVGTRISANHPSHSTARDKIHRTSEPRSPLTSAPFQSNFHPTKELHGSPQDRQDQALSRISNILNTTNQVQRTQEMLDLIENLHPVDFQSVVSGFSEAGWVDFNRSEFSLLLSSWISLDPHAAIAYLKTSKEDGWSRKMATSEWAAENPEAAANAIKGLKGDGKVNDWIVGLVKGIARNDPQQALLRLQQISGNDTRRSAMREILPEVISRGTDFAGDWIELIEDPKLQSETARSLGGALARRDPKSASDWIKGMTTVASRRDASEVVADIYASQNIDAARDWAESLPHDTMTEAAEGVTRHMARRNPAEAAQWLQKLGDDPDLDGARVQLIKEAMKTDPAVTLDSIPSLSHPADQERYYRQVLSSWKRANKQAAIDWAQDHSETLSERVYNSVVPKDQRDM